MTRTLSARLAARLGSQSEEARRALLLGLTLFALTGSFTLARTVRDALFLARFPADMLPYIFVGVGVASAGGSLVVARLTRHWPIRKSLGNGATLTALCLVTFAGLLQARVAALVFYLWVNLFSLVLFSQFWMFANSVANPREARRTFGTVAAAGTLGGLFGGLLSGTLSLWTPIALVVAAALLVLPVPFVVRALEARGPREDAPRPYAEKSSITTPYVRWLALMTLSLVVVSGLVDYQFKVDLQGRFRSADSLALVLALFYSGVNAAVLVLQLLLTRPLMRKLGAGWSSGLLPAGLGIGAVSMIVFPGLGSTLLTRLWDRALRFSVHRVAGELFYFPLERGLRQRARAAIEAGVRLSDAVAGVLILALGTIVGTSPRVAASATGSLVAVSVLAWVNVRRGYVGELALAVRRLDLSSSETRSPLREAGLLGELTRLLGSPLERRVLQSVHVLEEGAPELLREHLTDLLTHRAPQVRVRGLALVRARGETRVLGLVEALLRDPAPEVRAEALRTRVALLGTGSDRGDLTEYLAAADPRLRTAALVSLVEQSEDAEEGRLRDVLARTLSHGALEERLAVAQALGRREPGALHELLTPLLHDADPAIRAAALRSAGRGGRREHVPVLIEALGSVHLRPAARSGLAELGDGVTGTLGDYLGDPRVPLEVRLQIPATLGEIGTQGAVNALFRHRERGQVRLDYRVLKAADRIRAGSPHVLFPRARVSDDIRHDVEAYFSASVYRGALRAAGGSGPEWLLRVALEERMAYAFDRVFRRLALIYPPKTIRSSYEGIRSGDARRSGTAVEFLENALAPEHWRLIESLVGDPPSAGGPAPRDAYSGDRPHSLRESLQGMIRGDDAWLKALALHLAGERRDRSLLPFVEASRSVPDARVRETAAWAHALLSEA